MDSFHGQAFIGINRTGEKHSTIFIILDDRTAFDLIDLPPTDHLKPDGGHVLTKSIDAAAHVIFQHWIEKPKP